ncbi:MAG: hypothetical protein IJU37_00775, partial [Desulfovibrio sp.]|nr:hypothetical protein [Desulfovibrio sp.]
MNNAFRVPLRASGGMPEYRQQSAGPQPGTDVSARYDDRAASIMLAQANRNAQAEAQGWEQFNRGLQTFLKAGNKLYTDYRDKTSKSHITEALLRAQEEFATWQQDYDASHQGEAGIQAATDYENAWKHINQTHMQTLRERGVSGPYERHADLLFRQNGLHYAKAGTAFQQQQDRRWKSSLADGAFTALQNFVSSNPDDYERIGELKAQALSAYALAHPGEDMRAFEQKLNNAVATDSLNARLANGDWQGAERDLGIYGGATSLPHSYTGQARVLAKHESGNLGSAHVSYGLPRTDGVDVGKYSFITKGGHGGSVGEFLRWAGTQSGLGKQLHDKFQALTGGDWNKLDSKEFWKSKGGQAAWQEMVKSNPEAFERLEDSFWLPRLERQFSKLRPEVQQAIQADKTGALREMALSTLNQHKTAIKILNDNFDPNPETYIRNVYADRAQPARFAATGDPGIGQRRMRQEVQDVLGIFRGQASAPASVSSPGSQKRPETSMSEAAQSIGDTASSWLTP